VSSGYATRLAARAQLEPRREPVAARRWRPGCPIGSKQQRDYIEQGYLVLDDLLDAREVSLLREAAGRMLAQPEELLPETLVREPGGRDVRSVFAVHVQHRLFASLCANARLVDVASWLIGEEVYIHQSRLNYKPGFRGEPFYWHSDFETWHAEDGMPAMRALSMSLLLEENTACNGPLMVIPGSHRSFVPCVGETPESHYRESLRAQRYGVPDESVLEELVRTHGIRELVGPPGTLIVFDCNLMHGSNGNITPLPRANLFVVYNAASNRLGPPAAARRTRPEFLAARAAEPVRRRVGRLTS
jgi:ectoine hydroxylase